MSEEGGRIQEESGLQISSMIDKIMANPELISMVASALGGKNASGEGDAAKELNDTEEEGSSEEANTPVSLPSMEKLPELVAAIAPMLTSAGARGAPAHKLSPPKDKRACLLAALKPYLSRERCEAIDYMIRLGALSEVFRGLGG